ncbi:hypothetical protein D3C83_18560 [compost metagenome]
MLFKADSQSEMGRFVSAFWPPAHDEEFLELLWQATLQTLAIATAGMALALLIAVRPRRALGWALKGWTVWRTVRSAQRWWQLLSTTIGTPASR